ncbi:hypothetical protein ACFO25_11840 [Paenactinomyces guangxiensis]|uniref:Uncharacterized protein n=1 Tax=Paenactinomyces guangxiensis TaxID=1490290 RepID=A0A7W2A917_9BACL|nr:hypothetical protein [Paenactinomyces guangxiensis]MBA4496171.1 hypothetical protein [Paenactinomyces guangxiensis]MBH8593260.1 hypothetical protein [Paenactinomyces guangxiensis]
MAGSPCRGSRLNPPSWQSVKSGPGTDRYSDWSGHHQVWPGDVNEGGTAKENPFVLQG